MSRLALAGDGRLSRHLGRYFDLLGITYTAWNRKSHLSFSKFVRSHDVVLLAVSDRAIEPLARESSGKTVVHFSGALYTPLAHGFHPLMTFGEDLYSLSTYESIPFVLDCEPSVFERVFPTLKNPRYALEPGKKALYHALCSMSGNFASMLWTRLFEGLEDLGVPPEAAIPYLRQATENLAAHPRDPRSVWTGPLVRGDSGTVSAHLRALGDTDDPRDQQIYRAFAENFSEMLKEKNQ